MGFICNLFKPKTVEEIIAENSIGMSDAQKSAYWYELSQNIFAVLGKIDPLVTEISTQDWLTAAQSFSSGWSKSISRTRSPAMEPSARRYSTGTPSTSMRCTA